jgi:guanine deaminase
MPGGGHTDESAYRWIIRGNVVVPTGNPFHLVDSSETSTKNDDEELKLGPGLVIKLDHVLAISHAGVIVCFEPATEFFETHLKEQLEQQQERYIALRKDEFLCPGLIDLHIHAPQYAFTGTATDRPLMGPDGWLETYTFPTEQSFRDLQLARNVYERVVQKTLRMGTTTAVYFATLDLEPTKLLVDIALERGQRALIGNVCMDRNSPDAYCHSSDQNLRDTRELIEYIRNHPAQKSHLVGSDHLSPRVLPLVTPRFIPTCSPELLDGLAKIAQEYDCHITSHISESIDEVEFSRLLDEQDHGMTPARSDAEVFHSHRLLTNKCIMAHGVYLSDIDLDLMKAQGSAIAHCPLSNFYFAGGCMPCRKVMERGNKVGLGTDIAGGYSPSILNSCRDAVIASLSLQQQNPKESYSIDYMQAFYLATLGGAEALGLQDKIGTFRVGMEFDALVLSAANQGSPDIFPRDTVADVFQKLCILGDDRNISRVFVQGHEVT